MVDSALMCCHFFYVVVAQEARFNDFTVKWAACSLGENLLPKCEN
jgi:hypothetical protein